MSAISRWPLYVGYFGSMAPAVFGAAFSFRPEVLRTWGSLNLIPEAAWEACGILRSAFLPRPLESAAYFLSFLLGTLFTFFVISF